MASYHEFTNRFPNAYHGTVANIDNTIVAIENKVSTQIAGFDPGSLDVAEATFYLTGDYASSYQEAVEGFLKEVKHRQSLIEIANLFLKEMGDRKNQAEQNGGATSFTTGMEAFLDRHNIPYDLYTEFNLTAAQKAENVAYKMDPLGLFGWTYHEKFGYTTRDKADDRHDKNEWGVNIEHLNSFIKARTNEVQVDVTKINDLINRQNQIIESQTKILKKITSMRSAMDSNML